MGLERVTSAMVSATAAPGPLLPSHRFSMTSLRKSPFYEIPVHYLRRRGLFMVILCMGLIAYLHLHYLAPPGRLSTSGSFQVDPVELTAENGLEFSKSLGQILERPWSGSGPVKGVDEKGLEVVDGSLGIQEGLELKLGTSFDSEDRCDDGLSRTRMTIQFDFERERSRVGRHQEYLDREKKMEERRGVVEGMIRHAWEGYSQLAAPLDELRPQSGTGVDGSQGWGATLVDSMDTLYLAGMKQEFEWAKRTFLDQVKKHQWNRIGTTEEAEEEGEQEKDQQEESNFSKGTEGVASRPPAQSASIHFFEGVVRYLGGLLSIAELEQEGPDPEILNAATDLADQLVSAFQGPNPALPASRIFKNGSVGATESLFGKVSLADVGTLQLEFRKLSQLSKDEKFAQLADKNFEYLNQLKTRISGLYPSYFDPHHQGASQEYIASFGSLSGSFYEYLLKGYMMTDDARFKTQYISAVDAMHRYLISRPHDTAAPYLVLGVYNTATGILAPKMDHASCFAPGMLALGAKVLGRSKDMMVAKGLMETCFLSYKNSPDWQGLGADEIGFLGVEAHEGRDFEMPRPSGFYVMSQQYGLHPETIESLFVLYRITGDPKYQDYAWSIAQAIEKNCRTQHGYSTLNAEGMTDRMPGHFLAETLKYLYLIFSPPDVLSLDANIFSTRGHAFKFPIH